MNNQIIRKKTIWISVISGLVILNIMRWWPDDAQISLNKKSNTELDVVGLEVAVPEDTIQPEKGIVRDLFQLQIQKKEDPVKQVKPVKKHKRVLLSADELAQQNAEAGLASIKLIATAQRKGKLQAYLSKGESSLVVTEGMGFAQDYTVIKISVNSIAVIHNNTGIQKEIKLSE